MDFVKLLLRYTKFLNIYLVINLIYVFFFEESNPSEWKFFIIIIGTEEAKQM